MAKIDITFSQFCNYLAKTGMHRFNAAKAVNRELHTDYLISTDYWGPLRSQISHILSHSGKSEDLDFVLDKVSVDKKANYTSKIKGLKKFWGCKKLVKVSLNKKIWKYKNLRVKVAPELCYSYRDQIYAIKLFFSSADKKITKNEADLLLEIMKDSYDLNPNEVKIGILDVTKGKVFWMSPKAKCFTILIILLIYLILCKPRPMDYVKSLNN